MSKLFQKHPLPWSTGVNLSTQKAVFLDALNKEIDFSNPEVVLAFKQITDSLPNSNKR